jgi:hypothetical protein
MGRSRTAVPANVTRLGARIERWRKQRVQGRPMPAKLWEAAARLARAHGVYAVARALRVDYGALKARVAEDAGAGARRLGRSEGGFVEIDPVQLVRGLAPGEAVIEVWEQDGTRLLIRVPGEQAVDLVALVQAFRRPRS